MIGAQFDNYRITEKLGDGGMGSVYKAVDVMLERELALKFLRPELAQQKDLVERFRAEAVVLARLSHQNIASLYGLHRHGDDLFMAMEFVPGETLETWLRREGQIPLDRAVAVAGDVLQALDYAHRRGVVHRDVKTANIIVMPSGGVKVMDFGIARVLGTERRTRVGFVVGTIGYMAPEQIQGLDVDGRTDIYALGVVLYEMLTGRMPFQGETEYAIMQAQVQQMPVPPRVFAPIPVPVENAIMRALAKLPQERYQTAADFHLALRTAMHQSATYPAATAPFSSSADETREFKSDPMLHAHPVAESGEAPVYPLPGPTPPNPLPSTAGRAVAVPRATPAPPPVTPPPLPRSVGTGSSPASSPGGPAPQPGGPPPDEDSFTGMETVPMPPYRPGTEAFDPDATIIVSPGPSGPAWPPAGGRPSTGPRGVPNAAGGPTPTPVEPQAVPVAPPGRPVTPAIPAVPPAPSGTLAPQPAPLRPGTLPPPAAPPPPPGTWPPQAAPPPPGTQPPRAATPPPPGTLPPHAGPPPPPARGTGPVVAPAGEVGRAGTPAPPPAFEAAEEVARGASRPMAAATLTPPPVGPPHVAPPPVVSPATAPPATPTPRAVVPPVPPTPKAKPAAPARKGLNAGLVVVVAGVILLGVLAAAGYVAWQRWQQQSQGDQVADQTATTVPVETQSLSPPVDPSIAPVAPAVTQPAQTTAPKTVPKTTSTAPRSQPATKYEPLVSPVPPTVVTPQLQVPPPAPPPLKPVLPPAMFGDAKWMRVEGSRVREADALLQVTDEEVRILDGRGRATLARIPYTSVSHVVYSSGKRPTWLKGIGPAPSESLFESTVRTYHYLAFQGASQFVVVRIDRDHLPRIREELQKRAELNVETAR
jgi:serine/threonine-protein kinase